MGNFGEEFQATVTPVVVAFIIYNIIGVVGNILVIFVYGLRYPKNHFRCLVLALSFVDLTSCFTTVPMETVSTWYWFNAPSRVLCKAKNFSVQFTGLSAMYMLFVTALYKYRQICKPFKIQITQKLIIILCCIGIFASFSCAVPAAVIWDINNHTITVNNVSEFAMICEVHRDYHETLIPSMYRHLLSVYDIFLLATIVLYVFVAKTTFVHFRKMKSSHKPSLKQSCSATSNSSNGRFYLDKIESEDTISQVIVSKENYQQDQADNVTVNTEQAKDRSQVDKTPATIDRKPKPINIRKVLIMVIIAGTFSVTFLMALAFGYVFAIRDYQDYSSVTEIVVLFCCYRFYFINYALNPVIYFSLDTCFRRGIIKLFPSCNCKN